MDTMNDFVSETLDYMFNTQDFNVWFDKINTIKSDGSCENYIINVTDFRKLNNFDIQISRNNIFDYMMSKDMV